jgi:hypothetical protein
MLVRPACALCCHGQCHDGHCSCALTVCTLSSLLLLLLQRLLCLSDLCEAECDSHPLRTHVGRVLQRSLGMDPATVPLETRFMVRAQCMMIDKKSRGQEASALQQTFARGTAWLVLNI